MGLLDKLHSLLQTKRLDVSDRFELLREAISGTMSNFYMARDRQTERFKDMQGMAANAHMQRRQIAEHCKLDDSTLALLEQAMGSMGLSARAYDRILKVARTIADLENKESIDAAGISEAINYRTLDRTYWS